MNDTTTSARPGPGAREAVSVTCSACGQAATVPFTPTPGRPIYCRDCFAKRRPAEGGPRPAGPGGRGPGRFYGDQERAPKTARKRMLSQGRKAHFVYDIMEVLERGGTVPEDQRRGFVEMLFTRGARQSSEAAHEFVVEKRDEKSLSDAEANDIRRLLDRYSFYR